MTTAGQIVAGKLQVGAFDAIAALAVGACPSTQVGETPGVAEVMTLAVAECA